MPMSRTLLASIPLASLLLLPLSPAQDAPPAGAIPNVDRGDAFFKPEWHAGRRKALVETVKKGTPSRRPPRDGKAPSSSRAPSDKGVIVVRGAPPRRDYQRFRQ